MFKKSLLCAFLATIFTCSANTADASLILVLRSGSSAQVVVIDNEIAGTTVGSWTSTVDDSNATLGSAVFNGSYEQYSTVNVTAQSKPELPLNEMDLGGTVSTRESDTRELVAFAFDLGFAGTGPSFLSQTGGTNDGRFQARTFVNGSNTDYPGDFGLIADSGTFTPPDSPFSWSQTDNVAHGSPFAMFVEGRFSFDSPGGTTFDINLKQSNVPEPTTVLIWSMMAGIGLVVRRRR
jgi:hypothetical protein